MTDAPIRAALRAACRDVCRERCAEMGEPPCYEVCGDNGEELPWPAEGCNCADLTAAAVAEFLKQMDSVPLGNGFTFAALAAALARAAEGEG